MINVATSDTIDDIFPIYASPLEARWQRVIRDAVESSEHEADKWDIKFTLSEFSVTEDSAFKTIELGGKKFNIDWLKRQYMEVFQASFHKEFPGYKFKFIEEKIKIIITSEESYATA